MDVIGIDPAPAKGATVFDGEFRHYPPALLGNYLESLAERKDLLVCWDAPLTGPRSAAQPGQSIGDFTKRPIEHFFSRSHYGFKPPRGISVQGYAGCQHWTISRAFLGLPRIGPWDTPADNLPFTLVTSATFNPAADTGPFIAEVHPAVAIWRWCAPARPEISVWNYKTSHALQHELKHIILAEYDLELPPPSNDDELDALVAWLLGTRWLAGEGDVMNYGTHQTGCFLLPADQELTDAFDAFLESSGNL